MARLDPTGCFRIALTILREEADLMDVDDLVTSEVVVAVAATAAVLSSRVRRVARRGLVYGVAGALSAGDMLSSFGKGVAGGVQGATQSMQDVEGQPNQSDSKASKEQMA